MSKIYTRTVKDCVKCHHHEKGACEILKTVPTEKDLKTCYRAGWFDEVFFIHSVKISYVYLRLIGQTGWER